MRLIKWWLLYVPTAMAATFSLLLGAGLILQPPRYANTPSYANLINIAAPYMWGSAYLTIGLLMLLYMLQPGRERLAIAIHTVAFVLYLGWMVAFVIRWITNDGTTNVNPVSWLTYLGVVAFSAALIGTLQDSER